MILFLLLSLSVWAETPTFRLHLSIEPASLRPWDQKSATTGYFLSQIYAGLLKVDAGNLKANLAQKCWFEKPTQARCRISKEARFSNGTAITAEDFKRSWLEFLKPAHHAFRADILFSVKNAEKFFLGKATEKDVGLSIKGKDLLIIDLEKPDSEFLYTLTSPLLTAFPDTPIPEIDQAAKLITTGAYTIVSWEPQKKIRLKKRAEDIFVEFLFIQDETTALNLYEKGELQYLRRLPTLFFPKFKASPDLHSVAQIRLDYVGFGPQLDSWPELREALAKALDYSEIQKILFSEGQFGCPGLPDHLMKEIPCLKQDLKAAKEKLAQAQKKGALPRLTFAFSKQGGEDHKRVAEWMQAQWKKNLSLDVEIAQVDSKIFTESLKKNAYPLFRRGINPERPTCLAALDFFSPDSSENFLRIHNPKFSEVLRRLGRATKPTDRAQACTQGLHFLMDDYKMIPTGPIHFTVLAKPNWRGWQLNELNQLDLSNLQPAPSSVSH